MPSNRKPPGGARKSTPSSSKDDAVASTSAAAAASAVAAPAAAPAASTSSGIPATAVKIKSEPGTTMPPPTAPAAIKTERLPSYREQRDLTLGGLNPGRSSRSTANKKVFVPNLNVTRNKNADVQTSRDTSASSSRSRGGRSATRTPASRTPKPSTLVQTAGLFSEGSGEAKLRKSSSVFDRNASAGDSASQLRRPTLSKRETRLDANAERQSIQEVLGSLLLDDDNDGTAPTNGDETGTGSATSDIFAPVALVDRSRGDTSAGNSMFSTYPTSLAELFEKTDGQMLLMQLPDTLPGHGPDEEPAESAEAENQAAALQNPFASFCTAKQIDDGRIGRVVRRKSGKIQMILGDLVFNLSLGIDPGMLQEVMSVQTLDADPRHGNLYNLGPIQAKLNVTPDWQKLFASKAAENGRKATASNGGHRGG